MMGSQTLLIYNLNEVSVNTILDWVFCRHSKHPPRLHHLLVGAGLNFRDNKNTFMLYTSIIA